MKSIKLRVYGKINWVLDVISKRPDGYHNLEMVMQTVSLYDEVSIRKTSQGIKVASNWTSIPENENNIAFKAAKMVMESKQINGGTEIFLNKNIPVAAGMGGGSADAAAVLLGLNKLWNLDLDQGQLLKLAVSLGADVPFFLAGGTALARGIGEKLTTIKSFDDKFLLIVNPDLEVSTAKVYALLNLDRIKVRPNISEMVRALEMNNFQAIADSMSNVLEQVVIPSHPEVQEIKLSLLENGALGSLMSGSGPSVYGLFETYSDAEKAFNSLKKKYPKTWTVHTVNRSIDIVEELE